MSFTQFIKPYPDGYEDFEVGGTPVTAEILNTNYDGFLLGLNEFLPELAGMVEANPSESATAGNLTKLKVGNSIYLIPSGGSGGSTVEWEQLQLTGTRIATITIDNVPVDVYAPSGGGSGDEVEWAQVLGSGTEIGTITINGTPTTVYAPTPIDVEANPSGSATAGDLTKLKVGSSIYSVPSGGSGGASDLSDLDDVSITNVQNGQIIKWNSTTSKWENSNESSGGSGHTILDDDGTALAQEDDLQFKGVYSADNSEDGVTEVNVYREMTKSEFNLLSSDEKKGFIRVTDEPDIYSDGHFQPVIYSLEEREVGVWVDGKPLYQKTFIWNPTSTETTIDVSSLNIDKLVKRQGTFTRNNNGSIQQKDVEYRTETYTYNNYGIICEIRDANLIIRILEYTYSEISEIRITIQYTKTTDVAGSGTWTPQGAPTHKYSTEEHIVGTWVDGKTIYEKTIDLGSSGISVPANGTANTTDSISGIDALIWSFGISQTGKVFPHIGCSLGATYVQMENKTNNASNVRYFTYQYTKSS